MSSCERRQARSQRHATTTTPVTSVVRLSSRLVEEVKQKCPHIQLQNEDVYMATTFQDFIQLLVRKLRGEDQEEELLIDYVSVPPQPMSLPVCDCVVAVVTVIFGPPGDQRREQHDGEDAQPVLHRWQV